MPKQRAKKTAVAPKRTAKQSHRTSKPTKVSKPVLPKDNQPLVARRVSNVWMLTKAAALLLWNNKKLFITITLVYALLNLVLVKGFASGTNVADLKKQLDSLATGNFGGVLSGLGVFVLLLGSAGNTSNNTAGAYQLFSALVVSLAVIWALRQILAGKLLRSRDAYYKGMYPLVPFILVLLIIGLQLIPLAIGSSLYTAVMTNGIAVSIVEKLLWGGIFVALAAVSLYFLSSSLFALYIVTLPDMTPRQALRSAKQLVAGRRWLVLRKILFLPVLLLLIAAIIMVPIIIVATPLAQWVFFVLTVSSLVAIHTYMYMLYRELLDE
jgi:hypothetical protein